MSKFIYVTETRYNMALYLNIDNIVAIDNKSNTVYTNAVHGEGNGNFTLTESSMKLLREAIEASS